jgi:hypothetical protein
VRRALGRRGLRLRAAAALLAGALGPACKDRARPQPAGPTAGSSAEPASTKFAKLPNNAPSGPPTQNVLDLPPSSHAPPVKTTRPLGKAEYEKMSALEYPGWKRDVRYLNDKALEIHYKTEARPTLDVAIVASPCFDCMPPELARWKAKEAALRNVLPPELRERKDTVFEIGEVKLAGAPLIFTYQLGHGYGPGESQNREGPYSDAYTAYHNDGINQLRVMAMYADDPVATRDELANLAPRKDLEMIALAFLDAYTHAWAPTPGSPQKP